MQRISVFAAVLAFGCPFARAVTYDTYTWQPVDGEYSGDYTNAAHWSSNIAGGPGSGYPESTANVNQIAKFPSNFSNAGADYTVTLPQGLVTNVATPQFYAQPGHTLTIDGSQTTWVMPTLATGETYGNLSFYTGKRNASGNPIDGSGLLYRNNNSDTVTALGTFKNFKATLASETDDVAGTQLRLSGDLDWTGGNLNLHYGAAAGSRAEIILENGRMKKMPNLYMNFANATNIVTLDNFDAGLCEQGTGNQMWLGDYIGNDVPGLFEFNVINGSTWTNSYFLSGSFSLGYSYSGMGGRYSQGKTFRMNVKDSVFSTGTFNMNCRGYQELTVSGPGSKFLMTHTTQSNNFGVNGCATSHVAFVDGAYVYSGCALYFGGKTASAAESTYAELLVSNATLSIRRPLQVGRGKMTFVDGAKVQTSSGIDDLSFQGSGSEVGSSELYADDATVYLYSGPTAIIQNFTAAKLGPKGLTISLDKNTNHTIPQEFCDWTTDGTLTLLSRTSYSLTLSGADSRESNLVIAAGTVKLASGANHHSHLVVTNEATYSLVGGATGTTLRGLTLGDATSHGTLALDADEVVTVEGPINFVNPVITYSSTLETGVHTVFRMTVEPSDALVERWEIGGASFIASGLPSGYHLCTVVQEDDAWLFQIEINRTRPEQGDPTTWQGGDSWSAGTWSDGVPTETNVAVFGGTDAATVAIAEKRARTGGLTLANGKGVTISGGEVRISDAVDAAITVSSGTNEIASALRLVAETPITVAADAELTVSGRAYGLGFAKSGDGRLVFENEANTFASGFTLNGGWLTFLSPETMGFFSDLTTATLNAGTLEILEGGETQQGVAVTGPTVLKVEDDVSLVLKSGASGAIFKRGAGQATLDVSSDLTLSLTSSDSNTGYTTADALAYPASGAIPSKYNAITIAEGELALRGKGANRTVKMGSNYLTIGAPVLEHSGEVAREPGLVLDNVTLQDVKINLGCGLASSATFAVEPYIVVSNGASLAVVPEYCRSGDLHGVRTFVDNGSISGWDLNANGGLTVTNRFCLVNGSSLNSYHFITYGSAELAFTNSVWCWSWNASDRSQCKAFELYVYPGDMSPEGHVNAIFAQGSVCASWSLDTATSWSYHGAEFNFTFDDGEWWPGNDASLSIGSERLNLHIITQGDGLIIQPVSDQSFRLFTKVEGEGPLIKKGAGTLVVDCEYKGMKYTEDRIVCAYTGLTDVQEGTLAITNGALRQAEGILFRVAGTLDLDGASVTGAVITAAGGTVRNATLAAPTFKVEYDDERGAKGITLDYANGLATTGRVVFDFDGYAPGGQRLPTGTTLTVARWTGTKPDISHPRWRWANLPDKLVAIYTANSDGTITARICHDPGFVVIWK